MRKCRMSRTAIALLASLTVVGGVCSAPSAIAAAKPGYDTVGTEHSGSVTNFKPGALAMEYEFMSQYSTYYEGGFDRGFDGALAPGQFPLRAPRFPYVSKEVSSDGTVTLHYGGAVNAMAYCFGENGSRKVEARGNCQEDLTISEPTVTLNIEKKTYSLTAKVYYLDKVSKKYVGPEVKELVKFDPTDSYLTTINDGEIPPFEYTTMDGITTVKLPPGILNQEFVDSVVSVFDEIQDSGSLLSYPAEEGTPDSQSEDTSSGLTEDPVIIPFYPKSYANTLTYMAGAPVTIGEKYTRKPAFSDAAGKKISVPEGVTYSMREDSDPHFSVDEKTGVVTFDASPDSQKVTGAYSADGVVVAQYPDHSTNEAYIGFTVPGLDETADTFGPGTTSDPDKYVATREFPFPIVANEGKDPFSTVLSPTGKGLIYGSREGLAILEVGPYGFGGGFAVPGNTPENRIGDTAMVALIPQASKTLAIDGSVMKTFPTTSPNAQVIYRFGAPVTGFGVSQDYEKVGAIARSSDGKAKFTEFKAGVQDKRKQLQNYVNSGNIDDYSAAIPVREFELPDDLFGENTGLNVWGEDDPQGWSSDLLSLPDGNWLWIYDRALKDGKSSATPILIDPDAGTATVVPSLVEQFEGTRPVAQSLHGQIQGQNLVIFNQATRQDGLQKADPQSIGVYTYDPETKSFTTVGPVGAVNGVSGVVAAAFDEQGRPVFVDNANYLTVLDPKTREIVKGGKPFHGMERLASLNRKILVRKGDWYNTVGESADHNNVVIERAQPLAGSVEKAPEKTEAELYTPGVAKADKPAAAGVKATSSPVAFTVDDKEVDSPQGVTFAAAEGTDSRFSVDEATGAVSFTPTLADGVAGSVTVPVAVAYADGSTENVDVTIDVAKPAADVLYVVTYRDEFTPRGVAAGDTIAVNPVVTDFSGTRDDVADLGVTFALGKGASSDLSIDPTTGVVTVTVTKANLAAGSVKVPVVVTHADGTTTTAETTVKLVKRIQPEPTDKKPAPSAPSRDASSGSGEGGSIYGDAGVVGIVSLVAIIAAIAAAVTSTPGLVLPTLPGLPPAPRP